MAAGMEEARKSQGSRAPSLAPFGSAAADEAFEAPRLSRTQIWMVMTSLCVSTFVAALDITIISTALPAIAESFHSASMFTWVGSSYALGHACTITTWSMLSDIWGRRPALLVSLAVFFVGSVICALVRREMAFIAGRTIQGIGAGGMTTLGNVCISDLFSLRDRGLYFGIMSVNWAIATGIGPVLGGLFTEKLSFRWCFYINLPLSVVAFALLLWPLPTTLQARKTPFWQGVKAIDWTGSLLMAGGTFMFMLGLTYGGGVYPWASLVVWGLIIGGLAVIGLFGLVEWKLARFPTVPLRLLQGRTSIAALVVCFSHGFVLMGIAFFVPLYFQAVIGLGPMLAGVYVIPYVVCGALSAAIVGLVIQRTGQYLTAMYIGLAVTVVGTALLINLGIEPDWAKIIFYQIVAAVGIGINFEPVLIAFQATMAQKDVAAGTATFSFVRSISTAVSIVVGDVVFKNEMEHHKPAIIDSLGPLAGMQIAGGGGEEFMANIGLIKILPDPQQFVIKTALAQSLKKVWITYVAFALLGVAAGPFVGRHELDSHGPASAASKEREEEEPRLRPVQKVTSSATLYSIQSEAERELMRTAPRYFL